MSMQTETTAKVEKGTAASGTPVTIIRFAGDISSNSKDAVLGTYQKLSKEENKQILLDFSKSEYLNSSGIALVIQIMMEASKSGQTIHVFGLTAHFQKVFKMVGITKYATVHDSETAAKASVA